MSGRVEWSPKTADETVYRYADFTDELAPGEAIPGAACLATVWSGNDPTPQNIVGASVAIVNTAGILAVAQITISGGVVGTIYQCEMIAITNFGNHITKTAALAIKPPLN